MGKERNTNGRGSMGIAALALLDGGRPFNWSIFAGSEGKSKPVHVSDGNDPALLPKAKATTPVLVVTSKMSPGDVKAFGRFISTAQ